MKPEEKEKARLLRSQGWSVKQIQKQLKVSRGSVSRWVCDIVLNQDQIDRLKQNQRANSRFGSRAIHDYAIQRHEKYRKDGWIRAENDESFRVFCALYWGEGNKTQKMFGISNADHFMINKIVKWFAKNQMLEDVRLEVCHYEENGISEKEILSHWQKCLPDLISDNPIIVRRCKLSRASQKKNIGKQPYGTARLSLKKSTQFFFEVMGGIDWLKQEGG